MSKADRNNEIFDKVIGGATRASVADEHNLSAPGITLIVRRVAAARNKAVYDDLGSNSIEAIRSKAIFFARQGEGKP